MPNSKTKNIVWADKVHIGTIIILESTMTNYEFWNSNFRNELVKCDCLDVVKFAHNDSNKTSLIANKNVAMFLKKSVDSNLQQMIEGKTAYETYRDLAIMDLDKSSIVRAILTEVPLLSTHYMQAYVISQQSIRSGLMRADPQASEDASTHKAHMDRLLDGLASEQKLTMNYLISTREERRKETAIDVFKVGLKFINDLGTADSVIAAAAMAGAKQGKYKTGEYKCPRRPYLFHKRAICDLNPNTTDMVAPDKRRADKAPRVAGGSSGSKQSSGYKKTQADDFKILQAQVEALVKDSTVSSEENTPVCL